MSSRNKISYFLLLCFSLLLWHDLIPHHHAVGSDAEEFLTPEHHNDDDHFHFFTGIHTTHQASSTSEILHYQYQQTKPINQIALIPAILPEKPEFNPPEFKKKPVRVNHNVIPILEGISISCGLRAPPVV